MTETLVLGLGNLVHEDDGFGVHAISRLQQDPRFPHDVKLLDGGTQGLGLLHHLSGLQRLLVIDAIDAGEPGGTLLRFEGKALKGLPGKAGASIGVRGSDGGAATAWRFARGNCGTGRAA